MQSRLVLENDDKVYSARQTIALASRLGIPMVFDYHHHVVRNDGESLDQLLPQAFGTWSKRPPKVHLSSPRSVKNKRAHADYIDWDFALPFMESVRSQGMSVDVMIEAKMKDLALFQFRDRYNQQFG